MNRPEAVETPLGLLQSRRRRARGALGGGAMVLPAAPVQYASRDGERRYHPDRELYYVTGATEPGTVAVLTGSEGPGLVLFVRERDAGAELWSGSRLGPEGAAERYRPDECHPLAELEQRLPELLRQSDHVCFRMGRGDALERHVLEALAWARGRGQRTGTGPRAVVDPGEILDDMRIVKDEHELSRLRRAAEVTVAGHLAGSRRVAAGRGEWEVEAAIDGSFRAAGAHGPAFETIVGSGANACVLHYITNQCTIAEGSLVLVDAGAEVAFYHGDVTRTYPAGGRFQGAQRYVYELVDEARGAAVAAVCPGAAVADVHAAVLRVLVPGLVELGVLRGDVDALIAEEAHKPFYPHQTSHWLGLDVHDVGDYAQDGESRPLEPGMVLTVEPGLYFRPGLDGVPEKLAGIAVRIEDDVAVTPEGAEVLTRALPTALAEVEALVGGAA